MSNEQATASTTDVRHEIVVPAAVEDTFRVFAEMDRIKPREHNLLAVPIEATVVEQHVGGPIYDRGTDGSTCRWGRVLAFDPPHRFVLSWDIGPDWRIVDDPARASEVEVLFTALPAEGDSPRTRVELTHRHLERWQGVQQAVDHERG